MAILTLAGPLLAETIQIMSRQGHTGRITALAFSPDGAWIASAGEDRSVKIHDSRTGEVAASLNDHSGSIQTLAFSPDGHTLASAGCDPKVRLYDTAGFRLKGVLAGHELCATALRFNDTGKELAVASADGQLRFRNLASGKTGETLVHPGLTSFAFAGGVHVTVGAGGEIRLHTPGDPVEIIQAHRGRIDAVAASPDGERFATAGGDGTVRIWNASGTLHRKLGDGFLHAVSLAFVGGGGTIATGERDGSVRVWDIRRGIALSHHQEPAAAASIAYHAGRDLLAVASGGSLTVLRDGKPLVKVPGSAPFLEKIAHHPGKKQLAVASANGKIFIFDLTSGQMIREIRPHRDLITALAYHPSGNTIASASRDDTVVMWNLKLKRRPWFNFVGHAGIRALHFDHSGRTLAVLERTGTVKIWDTLHRKLAATHRPREDLLFPVFHAQRRLLAGNARDGRLRIFSLSEKEKPPMVGDGTRGVAFSANGDFLVSGGEKLRVWDLKNRKLLFSPAKTSERTTVLAVSPDGSNLAAVESGRTVRLWKVRQQKPHKTFRSPNGPVTALSFSADGRRLAGVGMDNSVAVWDVRTGKILSNLFLFPDGEWLVYRPERLAYASSKRGDSYAAVVFQSDTRKLAPLASYRGKLRSANIQKASGKRPIRISAP